jgi:hypothetical protein
VHYSRAFVVGHCGPSLNLIEAAAATAAQAGPRFDGADLGAGAGNVGHDLSAGIKAET